MFSGYSLFGTVSMSDSTNCQFSILDLIPIRDQATHRDALLQARTLAQHADEWGYHRYWIAEHHNMAGLASSATVVMLADVAAHTKRIRIGSGGIMLPNHAPLVVAEQFGTLATLHPNRIDLGVGRAPGTNLPTARALRRGFQGSEEQFPNDIVEIINYLDDPQPNQMIFAIPGYGTKVPVYILGSSLYGAQLAAHMGLPYAFASHFAPAMLLDAIEIYRRQFQPSRFLAEPYLMLGVPSVVAPTDEEAQYLASSYYQRFLARMRGKSTQLPPPVENMNSLWTPMEKEAVMADMAVLVAGSPQTVAQQLKELLQHTQANELIFTGDIYEPALRLRSFELLMGAKTEFK